MIGFQSIMAVGPRGKDGEQGEPGKDGTGTGTVNSVNDIEPDATGNIVLPVPPEPDLSGLATKVALKAYEDRRDNPNKVTSEQVNGVGIMIRGDMLPVEHPIGVSVTSVAPENGFPDWGSLTTIRTSYTGSGSIQLFSHYTSTNGFLKLRTSLGNYAGWSPWVDIVTSKLPPRINALMNAGWTNFPNSHEGLTYYKDAFGVVHVKGVVNRDAAAPKFIMNLPAGYRPLRSFFWGIGQFPPETVKGEITMNSNGDLSFNLGGINASVPIDISFRTD